MEGWQVVTAIGGVLFGAAMLRLLWVAAFRPRETITPVPELDGYVPGSRFRRDGRGLDDESDLDRSDSAVILEFRRSEQRRNGAGASGDVGSEAAALSVVEGHGEVVADFGRSDSNERFGSETDVEELTPTDATHTNDAALGDDTGRDDRSEEDTDHMRIVDDQGGVWIELDIEPLFPSSDGSPTRLVDLTEENEPEAQP